MDKLGKEWTIEEGIKEAIIREEGTCEYARKDNAYKKIGDIRTCHKCKKPVDVLMHDLFELDVMSITFCDECNEDEARPPALGAPGAATRSSARYVTPPKFKEESRE